MNQPGPNLDAIKFAALVCMTIDHVGAICFPDLVALRVVGRLALPWFICCLAYNYTHHTRDPDALLRRLLFAAFIAQPAYVFAFETPRLNILFTLAAGLWCSTRSTRAIVPALAVMLIGERLAGFNLVDGGAAGIAAVAAAVHARLIAAACLVMVLNVHQLHPVAYIYAAAAGLAVLLFTTSDGITFAPGRWIRSRWAWLIYYPGHLVVLKLWTW